MHGIGFDFNSVTGFNRDLDYFSNKVMQASIVATVVLVAAAVFALCSWNRERRALNAAAESARLQIEIDNANERRKFRMFVSTVALGILSMVIGAK